MKLIESVLVLESSVSDLVLTVPPMSGGTLNGVAGLLSELRVASRRGQWRVSSALQEEQWFPAECRLLAAEPLRWLAQSGYLDPLS